MNKIDNKSRFPTQDASHPQSATIERETTEETLRKNEKFFRHVIELSPVVLVIYDLVTERHTYFSNDALKIYGYTGEEMAQMQDPFAALLQPEDIPRIQENVNRLKRLGDGEINEFECRIRRGDGERRWINARSMIFARDEKGEARQVISATYDITERKETEEKLIESEKRFRSYFELGLIGMAITSPTKGCLAVNDEYCKILGYERDELLQRNWAELTHPEDLAADVAIFDRVMAGEIDGYRLDKRFIRKDNRIIDATISVKCVRRDDGSVDYFVGLLQDITERKLAEKALRRSEEQSRLLIEGATDFAIIRISSNGLISSWNSGAEKMFDYAEKEIIGQPVDVLFTPEDRDKGTPQKELAKALENGSAEDECWHLRKDGTRFFASGVVTRLNEKAEGFVKIARDQTQKLFAEKARRDKEILQKLARAQEDERKRIARDLHDELGQRLTALRLKLESVRNICEDNQELCERIDETQEIARRIDEGVDFLAWELRPSVLDDLGLFAALNRYVQEWAQHSGVRAEFSTSVKNEIRFAPEAETNLYRIVQEALNNTHKHARANRADVLLDKRGDSIILIIEDDGIGFNLENKKTRSKGLGLIGMQERASLIGGSLEIETAPKEGTTIYARIPVTGVKESSQK